MKKITFIFIVSICIINNSFPQSFKVLNYLKSISGIKTLTGEHNREPNSEPAAWTDSIYASTGKYPAFWSGDFLYESDNIANRWSMIHEAVKQWNSGAIVQLMFHTCPPTELEPCSWQGTGGVLSGLSGAQWRDLITDGTTLNNNWKARLDELVPYFQYLKQNGVEVLFRPLHEMNQKAFWWGGRPGPGGTARLFQITHDYMESKGLTNIIWVWDLQDFSTLSSDVTTYDPGSNYWDILALDVYYSDGQGYTAQKYNIIKAKAGNKPMAIGECQVLPTAGILSEQPQWAFFMGWSELVFSNNSIAQIISLYNSSKVVTLGEMPGWSNYSGLFNVESPMPKSYKLYQNYPDPFNPSTIISYFVPKSSIITIKIFDLFGRTVKTLVDEQKNPGSYKITFNAAGLSSGVYFYRLWSSDYTSIKKMLLLK